MTLLKQGAVSMRVVCVLRSAEGYPCLHLVLFASQHCPKWVMMIEGKVDPMGCKM